MPVPTLLRGRDVAAIRRQCDARLIRLEDKRRPWFDYSLQVVQELMPSRLQYMLDPQSDQKGFEQNDKVCDAVGHTSLSTASAAVYSGTMPSSSDWLDMVVRGMQQQEDEDAILYLQQSGRELLDMHNQSNASTTLPELHKEGLGLGTAAFLFVDDDEDGFRIDPYTAGEYFIDEDHRGRVDTIYRRTTLTVAQLVDEFGIESLSPTTKALVQRPEPDWDAPIACVHAIEPDRDGKNPIPSPDLPWRSVYYEERDPDTVLAIRGFKRFPAIVWRWGAKLPGCPYGFGFGHDALPHLIRLRKLIYRMGQVVAQKSDPATQGGPGQSQHEVKRLPGQHNTVFGQQPISNLLKVEMDEKALAEMIADTREQIREVIGATLVASLRRISHQMTAREADLRTSQDLTEWLPGLLRLNVELMAPYTELMWFRAEETGRLPQLPDSLDGRIIDPEFNSPLMRKQGEGEVQEMIETAAILGEIAKVRPEILQNFNFDKAARRIAKRKGWPADCYVPVDEVSKMRAAIAQQEAARKAAEAAQQGADVAETAANALRLEAS